MPSDADDLLVLKDLTYSYLGRFPALACVSLSVRRGEKVALLGANGCGKSTLLKVIDGLVFPDSGSFVAFGEEVTEDKLEDQQFNEGFRSRIGFIFQNSDAQVFSPTVREEIAFGPLNMAMERREVEARVADTLEMLDIADLADRAPYQLSGGQKKRVAIASVLVMNPEVLLFDEPTAALDPRSQQWLMELIVELSRAGKTIVLATHDLGTLDVLADRCVVFSEQHQVVGEGPPAEILANRELLLGVNLIHEHTHFHDDPSDAHDHAHEIGHHVGPEPQLTWDVPDPAAGPAAEVTTRVYLIPDISCDHCKRTIESAVSDVAGVTSVDVTVANKSVRVEGSSSDAAVRAVIGQAGFEVSAGHSDRQ